MDKETADERILYLNTFENTRGDIEPEAYTNLIAAPDRKTFLSLWDEMEKNYHYEFQINDEGLRESMKYFSKKYLNKGRLILGYTEEEQAVQKLYSMLTAHKTDRNIDAIRFVSEIWDIDPFSVSRMTVEDKYNSLQNTHHPDKETGDAERFMALRDSKDILLDFIDYRDSKLRDVYGTILPMVYEPI